MQNWSSDKITEHCASNYITNTMDNCVFIHRALEILLWTAAIADWAIFRSPSLSLSCRTFSIRRVSFRTSMCVYLILYIHHRPHNGVHLSLLLQSMWYVLDDQCFARKIRTGEYNDVVQWWWWSSVCVEEIDRLLCVNWIFSDADLNENDEITKEFTLHVFAILIIVENLFTYALLYQLSVSKYAK